MIWHEIIDPKEEILMEIFDLYDQIFPIEVREPHAVLIKSLQTSQMDASQSFRFLVGLDQTKVVSFATAHYFSRVNSGFIVYIGTDPSYQNHGIGSQTLAKMEDWLQENALQAGYESLRSIILEAEQIEIMSSEQERIECIKRNRFFEKNGYHHASHIPYVQPPLHAKESAVPLNLLIKLVQGFDMETVELMNIIYSMYIGKYGLINQINERILHECLQIMGICDRIPSV